jgi:hypothetical protein
LILPQQLMAHPDMDRDPVADSFDQYWYCWSEDTL